jgi:hypothetical protein
MPTGVKKIIVRTLRLTKYQGSIGHEPAVFCKRLNVTATSQRSVNFTTPLTYIDKTVSLCLCNICLKALCFGQQWSLWTHGCKILREILAELAFLLRVGEIPGLDIGPQNYPMIFVISSSPSCVYWDGILK